MIGQLIVRSNWVCVQFISLAAKENTYMRDAGDPDAQTRLDHCKYQALPFRIRWVVEVNLADSPYPPYANACGSTRGQLQIGVLVEYHEDVRARRTLMPGESCKARKIVLTRYHPKTQE